MLLRLTAVKDHLRSSLGSFGDHLCSGRSGIICGAVQNCFSMMILKRAGQIKISSRNPKPQ